MREIKTRETGKDIKVLDKSAVVGQRMKNAFIRSKRNAAALMDDRQATPSEYAEDKVEFAANDLAHDTVNVAVSGTKTVVRQGRKLFQGQRERRAAEKRRENTAPTEQTPAPKPPQGAAPEGQTPQRHSGTPPEGRLPRQRTNPPRDGQFPRQGTGPTQDRCLPHQRTGTAPERRPLPRYMRTAERPPACADVEPPADAASSFVECGRTFARKQATKWAERKRQAKKRPVQPDRPPQVKPQDTVKAPRQVETTVNAVETPVKTAKRPAQIMGQTAKATGRGAKGTVKSAQRTVKTAQRAAKGTVKTAQHTSKTAIKTADHTAKAAQKTAQATAKAAKMTAHAARATAKTAATAKAAAKGVSATVKAMIASVKALVAAIAAGGWVAILAIVIICLIGLIVGSCFGIFFSGKDSGTGQTMPAVVREINQEYEGKLDEIKNGTTHDALEMSGSRAVWPEVLAIYAVKTTTDPDNPQEVATMDDSKKELLKEIFWAMNEISSRTETATTTQIVETDDGEGYIIEEEVEVTTTTLYITVAHKTADEMADTYNFTADQRAQLAELLAEENRSMWSSALYGIGVGDGEIVVVALSQLGNVGGQPYWSWYGFNSRVEWCACFVSWCANECGYLDAGVIPKTAGCVTGSNWFKDRGLWQDNSYEPRPGDIIYFDWDEKGSSGPQDGLADHVGIVEKVENGLVYTVEGNSGDSCRENRYAIGHYEIYGYGTPAY